MLKTPHEERQERMESIMESATLLAIWALMAVAIIFRCCEV